jgi:hypothetical protein
MWGKFPVTRDADGHPRPTPEVAVSRCDECAARLDNARELVAKFRLTRVYGNVAVDHLDAALGALDVLRIRKRTTNLLTRTAADVQALVETFGQHGGSASWTGHLTFGRAYPDAYAKKRWSHVNAAAVQSIADDFRAHIHRASEFPMPFVPPGSFDGRTLAGCLLCGRDTLRVKESDVPEAWGREVRVDVSALGGSGRPAPVHGHVCPACREDVEKAGALGRRAVELAVIRFLGFKTIPGWSYELPKVRAWAALKPGTEANHEPWAHINGAAISAALTGKLGVRRITSKDSR